MKKSFKLHKITSIILSVLVILSIVVAVFIIPKDDVEAVTLVSKKKSTYGNPYAFYTFTLTLGTRTSTSISITAKATGYLEYSTSYLGTGTGYGLNAGVYIGGSWRTWTLKSSSTKWTGTTNHSASTTFTVSGLSNTTTSLTGVKVRVARSSGTGNPCTLNATSVSNVTIPANTSYKVTYNANGGEGAPAAQTKYKGVTLTLSGTKPTRDGYTFVGWNTSSTATTASYAAGASYTGNAALTLYAIWSKAITISYNANGGTGPPGNQSTTIYNATTSASFTIPDTKPTKSGYTFVGWSASSTATSSSYNPGTAYSFSNSTTLYAIWKKTITLTYNANGGTSPPANQSVTVYNSTTSSSFTISTTRPTKSGYTFVGWNTTNTATTSSYNPGESYTFSNSTTLYAIWSKTITLTYDANGGSSPPASQSATVYNATTSSSFTIPDTKPTKSGYTFVGWSATNTATTSSYNPGGSYSFSSSTTLYAIWKKTITLTYNANGGSSPPASQSATIYNSTTSASFTISTEKPTKNGYTFVGWSKTNTATSSSYNPGTAYNFSDNTTLYAIWKKTITLTYNANGGTSPPASQSATVYNATTSSSFTISTTRPKKSGYAFVGWSKTSTATTSSYNPGESYSFSDNTTLYAIWSKTITLTYDANGGTSPPASQSATIYNETTTSSFKISTEQPKKSGYTFVGWGTTNAATTSSYTPGESYDFSDNTTLYAIWSKTITLTYDANGGIDAPKSESATIYNATTSATFTITEEEPTKSGFTFKGWGTEATSNEVKYSSKGKITISNNTTLYAIWGVGTCSPFLIITA